MLYHYKGDLSHNDRAQSFMYDVISALEERGYGCAMWHDSDHIMVRTFIDVPDEVGTAIDTVMDLVYDLKNTPVVELPKRFVRP